MKSIILTLVFGLISSNALAVNVGDTVGESQYLYAEELEAPYGNDWFVYFTEATGMKQAVITGTGKTASFVGIYEFSCQPDNLGFYQREWKYAVNFGSVDSSIVPQQAIQNAINLGCE